MAAPVISASSSILGFKRNESFAFNPAATNIPVIWSAIGLPPGVTIETHPALAATGVEATDIVTATGNTFADGDMVYFPSLTGGAGLVANTVYYARDVSGATLKLAAVVGGTAINFTTDISAATIRKVSSGLISGSCATAGVYVATVTATNAGAESGTREFVFGISSDVSSSGGGDVALDALVINIRFPDLRPSIPGGSEAVPIAVDAGDAPEPFFAMKGRDVRMLIVRFVDSAGVRLDPDPDTLKFTIKEYYGDSQLVSAAAFEKTGSGTTAEFLIPVDLRDDIMLGAISGYEQQRSAAFIGVGEFEWTRDVTFNASPLTLTSSTPSFGVQVDGDLIP